MLSLRFMSRHRGRVQSLSVMSPEHGDREATHPHTHSGLKAIEMLLKLSFQGKTRPAAEEPGRSIRACFLVSSFLRVRALLFIPWVFVQHETLGTVNCRNPSQFLPRTNPRCRHRYNNSQEMGINSFHCAARIENHHVRECLSGSGQTFSVFPQHSCVQ